MTMIMIRIFSMYCVPGTVLSNLYVVVVVVVFPFNPNYAWAIC